MTGSFAGCSAQYIALHKIVKGPVAVQYWEMAGRTS
jgi:hypothetical protein